MWGGLEERLGVRTAPKEPDSESISGPSEPQASQAQDPPRKRPPFNLFGGLDFFGGLDGALGVTVKPKQPTAEEPEMLLTATVPVATQPLRSIFQPGRTSNDTDPPLVVLVHGLESHSGTWDNLMSRFASSPDQSPAFLAVDLRGHGLSSIGDPGEFHPATLAADVMQCADKHNTSGDRFILVGHSMGSRVATRLVADFPGRVSHLVIEDMDARLFDGMEYFGVQWRENGFDYEKAKEFQLSGESVKEVAKKLIEAAGPGTFQKDRVDGYVQRSRIFETPNGRTLSLIQPLGFCLAFDNVLGVDDMAAGIEEIAEAHRRTRQSSENTTVHLWRASEESGESCAASVPGEGGGVRWILETLGPDVHDAVFPNTGHSVHNDVGEVYEEKLRELAFGGTPATFE